MASSYPPPPLSSSGEQKGRTNIDDDPTKSYVYRLSTAAADSLSWFFTTYKSVGSTDKLPNAVHSALGTALVFTAGFAALAIVSPHGKDLVVSVGGFAYPIIATITESGHRYKDRPPAFTGYWILFALSAALGGMLRTVTPFFYFSKACILAWGASSARPYGGRAVLAVAFEVINNNKNSWPVPLEKLASIETLLATQASIPLRAFRLGLVVFCFGLVTFAVGVCAGVLCFVESVFCSGPRWVQANICILAGAAWPLYETLVAQARANQAASEEKRSKGGEHIDPRDDIRQGPAAVQWLSYWPIYASLLTLDPMLGWIPHFFSVKLAVLALLALPQTRGAYVITAFLSQLGSRRHL